MLFKKSVSPVVASLLLVTVAIVIGVYTFNWYYEYTEDVTRDISEKEYSKDIRTEYAMKNRIYGFSEYNNFKVDKVLIDGIECNITTTNETFSKGTFEVGFDESCTEDLEYSMNEILIITDKGSYKSMLSITNALSKSESSYSGDTDGGDEDNNDCSADYITYNGYTFSYSSLVNGQEEKLEYFESISDGSIKHSIEVICEDSIVNYIDQTYEKETICDGGFEVNGDTCNYVRYEISEDTLTLIDHDLNFEWQRTNFPNAMNKTNAFSYCDDLDYSNYYDWKLPEIDELETLRNESSGSEPKIVGGIEYFPEIKSDFYWSNTGTSSIYFGFQDLMKIGDISNNLYVLCFRNSNDGRERSGNGCSSGNITYNNLLFSYSSLLDEETKTSNKDESISNGKIRHSIDITCQDSTISYENTYKKETICDTGFKAEGDNCVGYERYEVLDNTLIDHDLNFEWQRTNFPEQMNEVDATSYCENLTHGNYNDWRLPEKTELETLIDKSEEPSPYIVGKYDYFPEIKKDNSYWTNTNGLTGREKVCFNYLGNFLVCEISIEEYTLCLRDFN